VRAVVTGGAGFIGSHVVDALLARGDEVHVLDDLSKGTRANVPEGAELHESDIRADAGGVFEAARPEVCFHLAAQADVRVSVERPDFDADVNVLGTLQILEAARRHGTKVVFSSTGGAIYGECDGPADEDHPRNPLAPYGVSKLAAEEYISAYTRLYGSEHVSLRYGNVYGPRQDPHGEAGVVAIFCGKLLAGERPVIYGDGRQTRDYTYVGDIVAANLAAAAHPEAHGAYNIGTGTECSVIEVLGALRKAAGLGEGELEPKFAPGRTGELQRSSLDVARARAELGFTADTDLVAGMKPTLEWTRSSAAA
jgi:UDP-glucose 4-epimerase